MSSSIGMSKKIIKNPHNSGIQFTPELIGTDQFSRVGFKRIYFKQDIVSLLRKKLVNLYISFILGIWLKDSNTDFVIGNCLFETVKVAENTNQYQCKYSGYHIRFDSRSECLWIDGSIKKNVIIFGADNSSFVHIDGRNNILVLGERPTKGLDNATITAEARYPNNFTE